MHDFKFDRRRMLQTALLGAVAVSCLSSTRGYAVGLVKISPNDATAKGLDYHADAKTVDTGDYPEYQAGQSCATCVQLIDAGNGQHGCKLMPGKEVNVNGWCKVWAAPER